MIFLDLLFVHYMYLRCFSHKSYCVLFQESLDVMSTNDDNTLGFTLELYSRYMEAAKVCELFSAFPVKENSESEPWIFFFCPRRNKLRS